ncbi:MAG: hypothetical protein QOJ66_3125 [Ilumatobacteraceae bacterium]
MPAYVELENLTETGRNGVEYAYRDTGGDGVPLVLFQHFRGNLDSWDPALIDELSAGRRVIVFDNVGVGGSSGVTPSSVAEMADGALIFLDALGVRIVDVLGFSLGSFVAQEIAITRPDAVRRLILASAAPEGAPGMHGWASEVIRAIGEPETDPMGYVGVFFAQSETSIAAAQAAAGRIFGPRANPDAPTTWDTRLAQYDAVCAWGVPDMAKLQRPTTIKSPVFVANGDSDPMILPRYSHLLAGLIPDARLKIYPDSAHGFLWQHHEEFAADVRMFLDTTDKGPGHG